MTGAFDAALIKQRLRLAEYLAEFPVYAVAGSNPHQFSQATAHCESLVSIGLGDCGSRTSR
jgi:hypothetical protein